MPKFLKIIVGMIRNTVLEISEDSAPGLSKRAKKIGGKVGAKTMKSEHTAKGHVVS